MSATRFKKTVATASPVDYVGLGIDENGFPYIIDELGAKTIIINAVNDKGWFDTEAALIAAYPPAGATDGWYAIVGSTDTVWVFDSGTVAWVNSGSSSSSFLAEIQAAAEKTNLVDTDKMGIVDVTGTPVTKWASLLNLYNYLKGKFDLVYNAIINDTDDISEGSFNKYNRIPSGGNVGQYLGKTSAVDLAVGWVTPPGATENIIANQGVDLVANKPVSGLIIGDIFVSSDTLKVFVATSATTFDTGTALISKQFVNDTNATPNLLYQYDGTVLEGTGDGGGAGGLPALTEDKIWKGNASNVAEEADFPVSGISSVLDDTSPQLGGFLDANNHAILEAKGVDVASAPNIVPLLGGNSFIVTGTTLINAIDIGTLWPAGAAIKLQFAGVLTLTHDGTVTGTNKKIILKKGANYTTVVNDVIYLWYNGTSWFEVNDLTKEAGGGAGGHVIQENGTIVSVTARANLNFIIANSEDNLTDDAGNDATVYTPTIKGNNDLDATGRNAADVLATNATNDGHEYVATKPDDKIQYSIEPNLSANGQLNVIIPSGYKVSAITVQETAGNAAGNVSIGLTAAATEIINAFTVGASADSLMTLVSTYFSKVNDTDLFVSSSAWGTGVIQLNFTMIKI